MWQFGHAPGILVAVPAQQGAGQGGVQRWYFQLVANRAVAAALPLEMVAVDGLRGAVVGVDTVVEACCAEVDQVQEGPFAQAAMRVGRVGTQQQGRAVDAATGKDVVTRANADLTACSVHALAIQRLA
ncbi:hypothetical protein D3C75_810420 [compost metagenome]